MLAWAPGYIAPGSTVKELVRNIDVAPTILELAGAGKPGAKPGAKPAVMDGRSVLGALRGAPAGQADEVLYEYYWEYAFPHTPTVFALRGPRYKYIYYHGVWDESELYDLQTDSLEQHNLIEVPAFQDRIRAMRARLFDRLEASGGMQIPLRRGDFQAAERRAHE
jgi:N-acetylglucosamine-6-sulfatase